MGSSLVRWAATEDVVRDHGGDPIRRPLRGAGHRFVRPSLMTEFLLTAATWSCL